MRDRFDLPVVWLLIALASVWAIGGFFGGGFGGLPLRMVGIVLLFDGFALIGWTVMTMRRAHTPVMPGQMPARLVTTGPFVLSRNPIYLGMALLVAGFALWLGAPTGLLLVPVFAAVITRRFILGEEARLTAAFGSDYTDWSARTGRWLALPRPDTNRH